MNIKLNNFIAFMLFTLLCGACKNKAVDYYRFEISEEQIQPEPNRVVVSGTYSFDGVVNSMKLILGLDEKLTDAVSYLMNLEGFDFSVNIDSLKPNTLYYYCYGVDFGLHNDYLTEIKSFNTRQGPPVVETIELIAQGEISFKVKCNVTSDGGAEITERGVYWNTTGELGINDHEVKHAENGLGSYSCQLDSLEPNTIYFVRAYAKNNIGTGLGAVVEFQTGNSPELPIVITADVSVITAISAKCGGEVINNGGTFSVRRRGVCWSTDPNFTMEDKFTNEGSGFGTFVSDVNDLDSNTIYYIKAYAIFKDQNNSIDTIYGEEKNFTTLSGGGPSTPITVSVNATPTIISEGENSQLMASALGGDGNYSYSWTPITALNNPNIQSPIASPAETTTYTCTVTCDNNTASSSCTITVVKAPTNLIAVVQDGNDVHLTWANANPAQTYKVYRNNIYLTSTPNTTYLDGNLSPDTYKYQVATLYEGVESPKSSVAIVEITSQIPEGVLGGLFSVSDTQQVYFSQGNLQYQASTHTWRFAENTWDVLGGGNNNISSTYDGWIDLFGWGTSGYNHNNACYQPWATEQTDNCYYAYGDSGKNLYDVDGNADWGYNAIQNGGNTVNRGWRTLTRKEWNHVLNIRESNNTISGVSNARYAKATVNRIAGVILFPDNFIEPDGVDIPANIINKSSIAFTHSFEPDAWDLLEKKGCVFLPVSGSRSGTSYNYADKGYYWSSSSGNDTSSFRLAFDSNSVIPSDAFNRSTGMSVRLVYPAEQ